MVHHAIFCLMAAFASNRMLVIDKPEEVFGLQKHFMPISQTCSNEKVQGINQVKKLGVRRKLSIALKDIWF